MDSGFIVANHLAVKWVRKRKKKHNENHVRYEITFLKKN